MSLISFILVVLDVVVTKNTPYWRYFPPIQISNVPQNYPLYIS